MGAPMMARAAIVAVASSLLVCAAIWCVVQDDVDDVGLLSRSTSKSQSKKYSGAEVLQSKPSHAEDEGDCADSESWRHGKHTCKWVAWESTPGKRCALKDTKGVAASTACRLACGTCPPSKRVLKASHIRQFSDLLAEEEDTEEPDTNLASWNPIKDWKKVHHLRGGACKHTWWCLAPLCCYWLPR